MEEIDYDEKESSIEEEGFEIIIQKEMNGI